MSGAADNEVITLEPPDVLDIDIDVAPASGEVIDLTFLAGRDLRTAEEEIIRLTNDLRRQHGLVPLTRNPQLDRAALGHTMEMVEHDFLDHVGRHSGSRLKDRAQLAGYGHGMLLGENLARGQRTPAEAVQGWLGSPGHRANLLHPSFREIGVACLEGRTTGPDGHTSPTIYWTQNFGAPSLTPVLLTAAAQQAANLLHAAGRQVEKLAGARPPAGQSAPAANQPASTASQRPAAPPPAPIDIDWLDE
jgi:uncharacterized protein YkwD